MSESRRTSRPDSGAGDPGGRAPREPRRRQPPRPLDSAGRPIDGFGPATPNGSGADAGRARERPPLDDGADRAASDWERLRDAAARAASPGTGTPFPGAAPSLASLVNLLEALRAALPQELERQFAALVREVLLTLRALIDWYLERLDEDGGAERRVEDIPID